MKFHLLTTTLLCLSGIFAQTKDVSIAQAFKLQEEKGKQAIEEKNYTEAQTIFSELNKQDESNPTYKLYLGLLDINLNEGKNACNLFKSAHTYKNETTKKLIREYCPEVLQNNLVFLDEVTQQPKVVIDKETINLFYLSTKKTVSGIEVSNFTSRQEFYRQVAYNYGKIDSKIAKKHNYVTVSFKINKDGLEVVDVIDNHTKETLSDIVKNFYVTVLNKNITYIPAQVYTQPVDLVGTFKLPIKIN